MFVSVSDLRFNELLHLGAMLTPVVQLASTKRQEYRWRVQDGSAAPAQAVVRSPSSNRCSVIQDGGQQAPYYLVLD